MVKQGRVTVTPRLRFPKFRDREGWKGVALGDASTPVSQRVGERKLTPVSISAGIGFVPQAEKFGRDISGNQYALYTLVRDGDFVYNKGNSLKFPQGCVYQLRGWGEVAAPNVFISFRLKQGFVAEFYQYCFERNIHGLQLQKHITSGARSNGLLNVSKDQFFGVEILTPQQDEQQKIADCLTSLDEVIAAQGHKVEALKAHKRGLMQQLFPRDGETRPRLRFPEFRNAPEWENVAIEDLGAVVTGNTPPTSRQDYYGGDRPFVSPADISDLRFVTRTKSTLSEDGFAIARSIPPMSVLFVCIGSTIGKVAQNIYECATNQQINAIVANKGTCSDFIYYLMSLESGRIAKLAGKQAVPIINKSMFSAVRVMAPKFGEQQRIGDCLASLDAQIAAESNQLTALKTHKQGLMQQLFPAPEAAQA